MNKVGLKDKKRLQRLTSTFSRFLLYYTKSLPLPGLTLNISGSANVDV